VRVWWWWAGVVAVGGTVVVVGGAVVGRGIELGRHQVGGTVAAVASSGGASVDELSKRFVAVVQRSRHQLGQAASRGAPGNNSLGRIEAVGTRGTGPQTSS